VSDLKLIGRSEKEFINEIGIVRIISKDFKMEFVLKSTRISLESFKVCRK